MSMYLMNPSTAQLLSLSPLNKCDAKYPKTCQRPQIICMATWKTLKSIHLQSTHSVKAQEGAFPLVYVLSPFPSLPLSAV